MTSNPIPLKFTLSLPGLPTRCPHCGRGVDVWPLATYLGQLSVTCPECHTRVGAVAALKGEQ